MSAFSHELNWSADVGKTIESAARAFPPLIPSTADDYRQVEELLLLGPDWNSYGAAPISETAAEHAKTIMYRVAWSAAKRAREARPYYIGPIPTGGVQLEWRGGDGREIRLEVRPDESLKAMFVGWENGHKTREYRDNISVLEVVPIIVDLAAGI